MYGFLGVKNCRAVVVEKFRKYSFSSGTLAILPSPPSLRTLTASSAKLWKYWFKN